MTLSPGDTICKGKYRVETLVGQGTFGEVYLVTHSDLKPRAVKVLRRTTAGIGSQDYATRRERFKFEAQLGDEITHPNVIKVYDFEATKSELYLVMEYAPNGSLAERLKKGPLTIEETVQLAFDLCNGLAGLHNQVHAIHRDLKPSNILFDGNGCAKIGDLGLAQVPGNDSRRDLLGSLAGAHPGTPAYMSPEQETTKSYLLPTSDIFALGCVLFEALTGKAYKTVYGTWVREHRKDVPEWLDAIVARALAETPGRIPADDTDQTKRYRLAEQMKSDLGTDFAAFQEEERKTAEAKRQRKEAETALPELPLDDAELRILAFMRAAPHRVAVQQVVAESGLPPDVVQRSLADLKGKGYIYQDERDSVAADHVAATYFTAEGRRPEIDRRVAAWQAAQSGVKPTAPAGKDAPLIPKRSFPLGWALFALGIASLGIGVLVPMSSLIIQAGLTVSGVFLVLAGLVMGLRNCSHQAVTAQAQTDDVAPPRKWPVGWILLALGLVAVIIWAVTRPGTPVVTPTPTALFAPTKAPTAALPTTASGPTQVPAPTKAAAPTIAPEPTKVPAAAAPTAVPVPTKAASAVCDPAKANSEIFAEVVYPKDGGITRNGVLEITNVVKTNGQIQIIGTAAGRAFTRYDLAIEYNSRKPECYSGQGQAYFWSSQDGKCSYELPFVSRTEPVVCGVLATIDTSAWVPSATGIYDVHMLLTAVKPDSNYDRREVWFSVAR